MTHFPAVKALAPRHVTSGAPVRSTEEVSRDLLATCPVCAVLGPVRRLAEHVRTDHGERPTTAGPGHLFRAGQLDAVRALAEIHGLRVADIVIAAIDQHLKRVSR